MRKVFLYLLVIGLILFIELFDFSSLNIDSDTVHDEEYIQRYSEGYDDGLSIGYESGREDGFQEGYDEGYREGYDYGFEEGYWALLKDIE